MNRPIHHCRMIALWAFILTATSSLATGAEPARTALPGANAAARSLADEILDSRLTKHNLPLSSDAEHARTIDPVMTRGAALWIHEAIPTPPLTVLGGRVFSYSDFTYDPLDAPVLKIRPIDDDQVVPFLLQISVTPEDGISGDTAVIVSFPAPPIFAPRISHVKGWVGRKAREVSVEYSLEGARLDLRVPLTDHDIDTTRGLDEIVTVIVAGELALGPYRPISANRFSHFDEEPTGSSFAGLAALELGRDIDTTDEQERLVSVAESLSATSVTAFDRVVAANSWVSKHLTYEKSPASRSAVEALEDRSGDCDEHSTLLVALLRAMRIPARRATGLLYNFNTLLTHAWVEVGLPTRDGTVRWFIVDPTLAGTSDLEHEKAAYVQFKNRTLLYPMKPSIHLQGMIGRNVAEILLNWRKPDTTGFAEPAEIVGFVDLVKSSVDREISAGARRLADAGLLLRRESASIVGSPYVLVDRPIAVTGSDHVTLRLENEERLVLDLTAHDGSQIDDEAIDRMRSAYRDLNLSFFAGRPAYYSLELVYLRDRHSDRLLTVRLHFGRFLVEHQLERILNRLLKVGLLTEKETARISAVAEASGGKNLYLLQELARQLPSADPP